MNKPIIFLGPSLNKESAQKILDAEYRMPAKKGDFLRLQNLTTGRIIVGLIDAVFLYNYPPTPIEVYQLIKNDKFVVTGAASLGALRAVELEKFGMIGIGKIFELFKKQVIDADDEVAVTFTEDEHKLQSEAMIDIRFNLFLAQRKGIIDENIKKKICRVAKNMYFPHRNYCDIIDLVKKKYPTLDSKLDSLRSYLETERQSLKERDAIKLLKYIKTLSNRTV